VWTSRSPTRFRGRATLSDNVRIYAVGDIHGSASLLKKLLLQIEMDDKRHPARRSIIVCLGDYLDRGPDSRLTIDLLMECSNRREIIFLKGNHETFVPRFLDDPATLDEWRLCGGLETLVSYGLTPSINPNRSDRERLAIELARRMPAAHRDFIESLDLSFCCGDFYFVHAGIRPEIPLVKQREEDLLWIRDDFLLWERPFEKFIVHGHTPVNSLDARSNRINIDTGAFATGRLTCIAIEESSIVPLVDLRSWHLGADTRATSDMYGLRIALAAAL
jgi:serine/threonine protein phosphatase 1